MAEQLGITKDKGFTSPGNDDDEKIAADEDEELVGADISLFRGSAARLKHMALDRPDSQYAAKETCREMARPMKASLRELTRLARYIVHAPRLIWQYTYQAWSQTLVVHVDANWAGCRRTRKSASGGCIQWGSHTLKTWSTIQSLIARSSGESELYGVIRGACESLGVQSLFADPGITMDVNMYIDASAAKGLVERYGLSKAERIDLDHLWIQQEQARRLLPLEQIDGVANPADLMTKHVSDCVIKKHAATLTLGFATGRPTAAAQLHVVSNKYKRVTGDSWASKGKPGHWKRHHVTWRRCGFTPFKVAGGLGPGVNLDPRRVSIGFKRICEQFKREYVWSDKECSHRMLPFEWQGDTYFFGTVYGMVETLAPGDDSTTTKQPTDLTPPTTDSQQKQNIQHPRGCRSSVV